MTNITIPGLYSNLKLNIAFYDYYTKNEDKVIDEKIFFTVTGSIPQNDWASNRNIINSPVLLYKDIFELLDKYQERGIICRFDCGSLLFDKNNYNVFGRTLLDCGDNGSNQIEINTIEAYNFLSSKYPNYRFVGGQSLLDLSDDMNLDFLVRSNLNPEYPEIFPAYKIEKLIGTPCAKCPIEKYSSCILQEHFAINSFSNKTIFSCEDFKTAYLEDEGTKCFQIGEYPNLLVQLEAYVHYLIKPEYWYEAFNTISKEIL